MMSFKALTEAFIAGDATRPFTIMAPESWAQGRTLYGGLSAALCHLASKVCAETEHPLKSALICFVGPSGGQVSGEAGVLRRGRSTVVADASLMTEAGVGTRAVFVYGADRESRIATSSLIMPAVRQPEDCPPFFGKRRPAFAENFDALQAGGSAPVTGAAQAELLVWCRHTTAVGADQTAALLAIADVLPPAAFTMFTEPAPISTITWSIEVLTPDIRVENDWFLIRSVAEHTQNGYSSQAMYVWDRKGQPVLAARQNVTIFY